LDRKIRIGAVSYLNTKPLLYGLQDKAIADQIEIRLDYPSRIATMLEEDSIDIGLIPIAIIPHLKEYHIIGDHCIGCDGPVASVAIFSEKPLAEVSEILLDYQSRTSVILARILINNFWKLDPVFRDTNGEEYRQSIRDDVAGLVIGDRALEQKKISRYMYDLGDAWKAYTGLPFVFAAWVSNKPLDEGFINLFNQANAFGIASLDKVIAMEKNPPADLKEYYANNISYSFDAEKQSGMKLFMSMLEEINTKDGHPLFLNTEG
jgi:chorismate dehydratase